MSRWKSVRSAASFMLASGVPMRVVMEVRVHAGMNVTASLYSQVAPEMQRQAAERVGEML